MFYLDQWFEDTPFTRQLLDYDLSHLLDTLTGLHPVTYFEKGSVVVFLPLEGLGEGRVRTIEHKIIVGDEADLGRYTSARVTGTLRDAQTHSPLTGATVQIINTTHVATTDIDGRFSFRLPVGEHRIKVSFIGYEDLYRDLYLYSDGEIELDLFDDIVLLEGVTVSARRSGGSVGGTRMSMISMDSKAIRELPVSFGEGDIIRSFTLMPGVQAVGEFGSGFNVRGGSTDQNLILLEGMPLFNSSHLFGLTSVVNSDMVSEVDMIKAGIPAKFGERVSSVMNIKMSEQDLDQQQINGGVGLLNSRLQVKSPIYKDHVSVALSGRSSYSNWFLENMPDNDLMNSEADFYDLAGVINIKPSDRQFFSVFGYQSEDNFMMAAQSQYNYKSQIGSLEWSGWLAENLRTNLTVGFSNYFYQVEENLSTNFGNAYRLNSNIRYQSAKWNFNYYPTDVHSLEMGVNSISYRINPGHIEPSHQDSYIVPNKIDQENAAEFAVYVSDNINISPQWDIEVGLRYSFYQMFGPSKVFKYEPDQPRSPLTITDSIVYQDRESVARYHGAEPRLSLRYGWDEFSSLKFSYNRIHQYINLLSNTSVMNPSDIWKLSDTYVKPLRSDQFALGYFKNFAQNNIETSLEVYYKNLQNVVEYKNGAQLLMNENIETDLLNARGYNYGAELSIEKLSGRLTGWFSYTFSLSRYRTSGEHPEMQINRNEYFPSNHEQPHNLVLNANYNLSRRWRINSTFVYSTGRPTTLPEFAYEFDNNQIIYFSDRNKYRMPDYHRLDVAITWDQNLKKKRSWKGSWTLSIVNLYARKNAYSIFYQKDTPSNQNDFRHFSLYKMYIIGVPLPTLTYNFSF